MNPLPQLIVLDLDGVIRVNSRDRESPFYRITSPRLSVIKPGVRESFELLFASEIDFVICTKQRALKDGTLVEKDFYDMWRGLVNTLRPKLYGHIEIPLYVEVNNPTKIEQFKRIQRDYHAIPPERITVLDDSMKECAAAASIGMNPMQTTNLWVATCEILGVTP